jgi:hypothetical protein
MWINRQAKYINPSAAHERALRLKSAGAKNIVITPRHGIHVITWMERDPETHPNYPNFQSGRGRGPYTVQGHGETDGLLEPGFRTIEEAVEWGLARARKKPAGQRAFDVSGPSGEIVWSWQQRPEYNSQGGKRKIVAHSFERYNGGVRIKRQYGSSTVTRFYVYYAGDEKDPSKWKIVEGYGPTPGDRKTDAIRRSGLLEEG